MHAARDPLVDNEGGGRIAHGGVTPAATLARLGVLHKLESRFLSYLARLLEGIQGLKQHSDWVAAADRITVVLEVLVETRGVLFLNQIHSL